MKRKKFDKAVELNCKLQIAYLQQSMLKLESEKFSDDTHLNLADEINDYLERNACQYNRIFFSKENIKNLLIFQTVDNKKYIANLEQQFKDL